MSKSNSELLRELRELTAAGMKDCKDALEEAGWDLSKAVDIVKTKGLQNVSRTAGKTSAEGRVAAMYCGNERRVAMVEVNSQTDFVAGSPEFSEFLSDVLGSICLQMDSTIPFDPKFPHIETKRQELVAKTKENIVIRRWWVEEVGLGCRAFAYVHPNPDNGKVGAIISLQTPNEEIAASTELADLAMNLAMQVVAMNPLAVSRDQLPPTEVERQRVIFETQLKELNKPEAAWPKIMEGKFNKWFTEVCLLDQEAVFATKVSISAAMYNVSKQLCGEAGKIKVLNFVRCQVGEGIEVEKTDLAAEVEKLSGVAQRS